MHVSSVEISLLGWGWGENIWRRSKSLYIGKIIVSVGHLVQSSSRSSGRIKLSDTKKKETKPLHMVKSWKRFVMLEGALLRSLHSVDFRKNPGMEKNDFIT